MPEKLRAFVPLGKVPAVTTCNEPLKSLDQRIEQATEPEELQAAKAELSSKLDETKRVLKETISQRLSARNVAQNCLEVLARGLDFFQGSYNEIFSMIEKSEDLNAYREPTDELRKRAKGAHEKLHSWLSIEYAAKKRALQRTGQIHELMADACSAVVVDGYGSVLDAVQAAVPKATSGVDGDRLKLGPLKRSSRIVEKVMLRADDEGNADCVCDLRRSLVVATTMTDFATVLKVFLSLVEEEVICVVRVKDRIRAPAAGWRDVMLNFYFVADPNRHVCEVQVAHLKMLTARVGLDGHAVYGRVRNAVEQLEKLRVCEGRSHMLPKLARFVDNHGLDAPSGIKLQMNRKGLDDPNLQALCALWLSHTALPRIKELAQVSLQYSDQLKELNLQSNFIGDDGLASLAEAIADEGALPNLQELILSDNIIKNYGCARLAAAIEKGGLRKLRDLQIGGNEIDDEGIVKFAPSLAHLTSLIELGLEDNNIGDRGLRALADVVALGSLSQLRVLALDDNLFTGEGMRAFVNASSPPNEAAPHPQPLASLESLDLDGNDLDAEALNVFAAALDANAMPALMVLEIDDRLLTHAELVAACGRRDVTVR